MVEKANRCIDLLPDVTQMPGWFWVLCAVAVVIGVVKFRDYLDRTPQGQANVQVAAALIAASVTAPWLCYGVTHYILPVLNPGCTP